MSLNESLGYRRQNGFYGTTNASIVMAAFLHVAPGGIQFNGPELGAWYAADDIRTAAAEVGHHLRRETVARNLTTMTRTYRAYAATLLGDYLDIRGEQTIRPDVYASDRYDASQKFGEEVRASGGAGLIYDSLRRRSGVNVVAHRPRNISGHRTDRSFRNYRPGNVARDRRPQTVAVMRGPWPDGRVLKRTSASHRSGHLMTNDF